MKTKLIGILGLMLVFGFSILPVTEAQAGTRITKCVIVKNFAGGESTTSAAPLPGAAGGTDVVSCPVTAPATGSGFRTYLVTYSATGDTHSVSSANSMQAGCRVDPGAIPCWTTAPFASGVTGWTVVQNPGVDAHDNNIHQTWCVQVAVSTTAATVKTFTLKLASTNGVDGVFNEGITFTIDDIGGGKQCKSGGV